jgi:hypothetical protein
MTARYKRAEKYYHAYLAKFHKVPTEEHEIVGLLMDHEEDLKKAFVERLVSYEKMINDD